MESQFNFSSTSTFYKAFSTKWDPVAFTMLIHFIDYMADEGKYQEEVGRHSKDTVVGMNGVANNKLDPSKDKYK